MKLPFKIISLIAIFTILLIIIFILIFWPSIREIKNISKEIYEQRVELEKKYLAGQNLKKAVSDYEQAKPYLAQLETIFIKTEGELEFITTLEKLAEKNNIEQKINLSLDGEKINTPGQSLPITLNLRGNFVDLLGYLWDLETLNYYVNLETISMTSSTTETGLSSLKIETRGIPKNEIPGVVEVVLAGKIYLKK